MVVALGALLGAGPVANAGEWKVTSITTGGKSTYPADTVNSENDRNYPKSGTIDWEAGAYDGVGYINGGAGYSNTTETDITAKVTEKGSGEVVFEWLDANGQPDTSPAPAYLYYLVDSDVYVGGNAHVSSSVTGGNGSVEIQADNGIETGTPVIVAESGGRGKNGSANVRTKRVFRKETNGSKKFTVLLPVIDSYAEIVLPSGDTNSVYGVFRTTAHITVKKDSRYISLARPGARGPVKQESDPTITIDPTKDEWVAKNGDAHGQSRWSYTTRVRNPPLPPLGVPDYDDTPTELTQLITAQKGPAGWSTSLSGQWSPSHSMDQQHPQSSSPSHIQELPDGGAVLNDAGLTDFSVEIAPGWYNVPSSGSPNPVVVTYTLKDNADGAEAQGKYFLHLHDEWENPTDDISKLWIEAPNILHFGETVSSWFFKPLSFPGGALTTSNPDSTWQVTQTGDVAVGMKAEFTPSFKVADWLKVGGSFTASANMGILATYASLAPKPSTKNAPAGSSFQPVLKYKVKSVHKLVDHYDVSGFDPNEGRLDKKTPQSADVGLVQTEPDWLVIVPGQTPADDDGTYPEPWPIPGG